MKINRWNYTTRQYETVTIPDSWYSVLAGDPNEEVHCVKCGKMIRRGNSFHSLEYHTDAGISYPVCDDCYREEMRRKLKDAENNKGIRRKEDS